MEEPKQEDFEDYEEYLDAKIEHSVEKSISKPGQDLTPQPAAAGVKEALTPPPSFEPPYLKDPEIAEEIQREKEKAELFADIAILGEMGTKESPSWDDPLFRRGLGNRVANWNSNNEQNLILLPAEEGPFGEVKELRPENMLFFKFDSPQERDRILRNAENFSGDRFRRTWSALRQTGYFPEHARPTFHATEEDYEAEEARHRYEGLSQAEYEKLREKEGARRW